MINNENYQIVKLGYLCWWYLSLNDDDDEKMKECHNCHHHCLTFFFFRRNRENRNKKFRKKWVKIILIMMMMMMIMIDHFVDAFFVFVLDVCCVNWQMFCLVFSAKSFYCFKIFSNYWFSDFNFKWKLTKILWSTICLKYRLNEKFVVGVYLIFKVKFIRSVCLFVVSTLYDFFL